MCKRIYSNQTNEIGEIPFYKIGTLGFKADSFISKELFTFLKSKYKYPSKKEVLISCSGTIGRCIQFTGENSYFQDSNIVWLINDEKNIINDFLYFVIYRYDWSFLNTTTIKRLFTKDINNLKIIFPKSHNEQFKISNFLSLVDSKINILNNKISLLKKYKDGYSKAVIKSCSNNNIILSSVCDITTGKLDANAMSEHGKYKFFTCAREDYLIDTYAFDCEAILVSGNGDVGLTKYYKGKFNAYQRTYVLYNFKRDPLFIQICIDSQIKSVIRKETNKGAMPYIKLSTFNKLIVPDLAIDKEKIISTNIKLLKEKQRLLDLELEALSLMKKHLLNTLFI